MPKYLTVPEQAELLEVVSSRLGSARVTLMRVNESFELLGANADALDTMEASRDNARAMLLVWIDEATMLLWDNLRLAERVLQQTAAQMDGVVFDKRREIDVARREIRKRRAGVVEQLTILSMQYAQMYGDHIKPLLDKVVDS